MTEPGSASVGSSHALAEHIDVAEAGKTAALRGNHAQALAHYRTAMRLATANHAPEVFLRHYLEVALESLELIDEFDTVLEYCDRAAAHYTEHPPQHQLAWLDVASIHQRKGAVLLKAGRRDEARVEFDRAVELAERIGARLELALVLRGWIARSLFVSKERVTQEQRRLHYFSVRPDTLVNVQRT